MKPVVSALLLCLAPALASSSALAQGAPVQLPGAAGPASKAINRTVAPPRVSSQDAAETVKKANAWLNSVHTMVADFSQVGADGRRVAGKLYLEKPGKLRFEYDKPSPLEIIADGKSVAVRNRRLNKQDLYFIGQTPLKFLLQQRIDIARDTKILDVKNDGGSATIYIEDKATFGGTSRIRLVFDANTSALKQWTVLDPQGYETRVTLSGVDLKSKPDSSRFVINYERQD